jgi:phage major head subunit gpT-like protein
LEAAGFKTRGKSRQEIVAASLMSPNEFTYRFGAAATTSDFPNILANIATKTLRQGYDAAPPTFRTIARQVNVPDFKQAKSVNISDLAALQKVNESGEFHVIYLSDNGEPYAVGAYGNIVSITRQVIINDDLRSLVRVPAELGRAAARMESDVFWKIITANAAMADSVAIFHATHANLNGTNALALGALGTARAQMRLQTAPNGTILGIMPKAIVVPAALEQTALQLVNPMQLAATSATTVIPQWITQMQVVTEARLDADSTTNWYAVADGDGMIYSYLEGQEGVYTETQMGFETDGVKIKARSDFGAAMVEFRWWQKNTSS